MNTEGWSSVVIAVVVAIIGLATLAVIVSNSANTAGVIQAASSGLGTIIGAAVAPVSSTSIGAGVSGIGNIGSGLGITLPSLNFSGLTTGASSLLGNSTNLLTGGTAGYGGGSPGTAGILYPTVSGGQDFGGGCDLPGGCGTV